MTRSSNFHLTLLHFNDLHGRLADVTACGIAPIFSRIAGHIRATRERCLGRADAGVLVLAAGDDLVGSPFAELAGCAPAGFRCHPAYRIYSAAGVDAVVIGNHDLDWGLALLAHAAGHDAAFPLLSANLSFGPGFNSDPCAARRVAVYENRSTKGHEGSRSSFLRGFSCDLVDRTTHEATGQRLSIYPAALVAVNGLRVGVIGLTTPAEVKHILPGEFAITDPVQAARELVPLVRPSCDVLIILSHLGYSLNSTSAVTAGAGDVELARALPPGAVQLIVGGHTHSALNSGGLDPANIVNGIPIVQAGAKGAYLGQVEIEVSSQGAVVTAAWLHRVADLPADPDFEAAQVGPLAEQVRALLGEPIGQRADDPDLIAADVRATFASAESALANFLADALVARSRAAGLSVDFALVDASALGSGLPACEVLTFGDLFALLPYADSIALCRIAPAQLRELLDDNARRADRPGEPHVERGFLQFSREVRYTAALGPERRAARAAAITVAGVPLAELLATRSAPFLVACSSFVRELAAAWARSDDAAGLGLLDLRTWLVRDTGRALRHEILEFVRECGGITAAAGARRDGRVRFG